MFLCKYVKSSLSLFNDVLIALLKWRRTVVLFVIEKLERMCKLAVVAYFKVHIPKCA
jgi:hypothetical protein